MGVFNWFRKHGKLHVISLIAGYLIDIDATSLDGEVGDGRGGGGILSGVSSGSRQVKSPSSTHSCHLYETTLSKGWNKLMRMITHYLNAKTHDTQIQSSRLAKTSFSIWLLEIDSSLSNCPRGKIEPLKVVADWFWQVICLNLIIFQIYFANVISTNRVEHVCLALDSQKIDFFADRVSVTYSTLTSELITSVTCPPGSKWESQSLTGNRLS